MLPLASNRSSRFEVKVQGGERIAFHHPGSLPPSPPIDLAKLQILLDKANQTLGRLDGISTVLPDPHFFLYSYVRKEALLSSQIEGTQSSLLDLLLFEHAQTEGLPIDDVMEMAEWVVY